MEPLQLAESGAELIDYEQGDAEEEAGDRGEAARCEEEDEVFLKTVADGTVPQQLEGELFVSRHSVQSRG